MIKLFPDSTDKKRQKGSSAEQNRWEWKWNYRHSMLPCLHLLKDKNVLINVLINELVDLKTSPTCRK